MEEILHQLIGSLSRYLQGLYVPGGAGFLPPTVPQVRSIKKQSLEIGRIDTQKGDALWKGSSVQFQEK